MSDYDDLIPKGGATATAPAPSGGYDDLIPKAGAAVKHADTNLGKIAGNIAKPIGSAIVYGTKHPFDAAMNVLGAPQRGLQALETGGNIGHSIMTPSTGPGLTKAVKSKVGLTGLEAGPLAGSDLPHKLARGVLDTGLDVVNDPLTFLPFGAIGKALKVGKLAAPVTDALKSTKIGKALDPEAALAGLTPKGKGTYEAITNRAVSNVKALGDKEDAVIRQHANEIRAGQMPPEVASLFRSAKNVPAVTKGTRPQEVVSALARDRAGVKFAQQNAELRNAGLIKGGKGAPKITLKNPADLFEDPSQIAEVQKRLGSIGRGAANKNDPLLNIARQATRLGNKAFLANPIPHTFNLANLAYNKYGLPTTLAGLGNAARVATGTVGKGKLAQDIGELGNLGAKSEYRNIFDELGLTGNKYIPGSMTAAKVANLGLIPAQKLSNLAQHKILNSTETGLRAAALNAEKAGGKQGVEAARGIHSTFGTGPQSALIKSIAEKGTPFAQFHLATAPGSGISTLAKNPGRVANVLKTNRDMNAQVNPGSSAKYRSSIPSMSTARALAAPLSYFSNLGPLSELNSPYGAIEQAKKGPKGLLNLAGDTASRFIPGAPEIAALKDMIEKKRGRLSEPALNDLIASLVGGYYGK